MIIAKEVRMLSTIENPAKLEDWKKDALILDEIWLEFPEHSVKLSFEEFSIQKFEEMYAYYLRARRFAARVLWLLKKIEEKK